MIPRFTSHGKQVLLDGKHYADAVDERAAADIAFARNHTKCRDRNITPLNPSTESVRVGE